MLKVYSGKDENRKPAGLEFRLEQISPTCLVLLAKEDIREDKPENWFKIQYIQETGPTANPFIVFRKSDHIPDWLEDYFEPRT